MCHLELECKEKEIKSRSLNPVNPLVATGMSFAHHVTARNNMNSINTNIGNDVTYNESEYKKDKPNVNSQNK